MPVLKGKEIHCVVEAENNSFFYVKYSANECFRQYKKALSIAKVFWANSQFLVFFVSRLVSCLSLS